MVGHGGIHALGFELNEVGGGGVGGTSGQPTQVDVESGLSRPGPSMSVEGVGRVGRKGVRPLMRMRQYVRRAFGGGVKGVEAKGPGEGGGAEEVLAETNGAGGDGERRGRWRRAAVLLGFDDIGKAKKGAGAGEGGERQTSLLPSATAMVRSRVEPKTFFAAERTFLAWVNIAVLVRGEPAVHGSCSQSFSSLIISLPSFSWFSLSPSLFSGHVHLPLPPRKRGQLLCRLLISHL
jgi:hypothetical protein